VALAYVLMAVIGAAVAIFALQNLDPVVIRFVAWRIEGAPLALVVLLALITGVVLTALVGLVQQWKLRSRVRHLERSLAQAEAQAPLAPGRLEGGRPRPDAPPS